MSIFSKPHTLISEDQAVGAFQNEAELQYQFVNLSLGELCPATIIYPTISGEYKRIDTLRARDFYVCCYPQTQDSIYSNCDCLCVNISECLHNICHGKSQSCLTTYLSEPYEFIDAGDFEYLEFMCPISGLYKFAFPIKFNQKLICVVFVGQYSITKTEYSKNLSISPNNGRKQFGSKEALRDYISQKIVPEIQQFLKNTSDCFEKSEKRELKRLISSSEQALNKSMIELLHYNANSRFDDYSTRTLDIFWTKVRNAYSALFDELGAFHAILYINDDFGDNVRSSKNLGGIDIFHESKQYPDEIDRTATFNNLLANSLCQKSGDTLVSSISNVNNELLLCFTDLPVSDIYQYDYVFYSNGTHLPYAIMIIHEKSDRDLSPAFVEIANKIASNIRFELSSVLTKLSEYATKSILRIYRHEIVHQVLALRTSINSLNPTGSTFISPEKLSNVYYDCSDCLSELSFMTENIKLFTGQSSTLYGINGACSFETIDIFKDVINKHIVMHRELRKSKHLWFGISGKSEYSHRLQCYPLLLDLLLFNIVSNAVKYAHYGSNIWFDYSIAEEKHQTRLLVIRDYGCSISTGNEIYRLYYRGPDIANVENGSGIGLYIAKRLAEIMGINLYHQCTKVSDYNVPLFEKYLCSYHQVTSSDYPNRPCLSVIQDELDRLKNDKRYNQIINTTASDNENELCIGEIMSNISLATYEVAFILEL